MELAKKAIHTDNLKSKALLQIPFEEDINVSDSKPDVSKIIYTDGAVKVDEIKTGMNKIWVKGRLCYQILYQAEGTDNRLAGMDGAVPFMEEIYLDRIEGQDRVVCRSVLEDMRVHIINSRKLSIQSVICLEPKVEETVSEELCTELLPNDSGDEMSDKLEYRKKSIDYLETVIKKRDLVRIHEETKLPSSMPEIGAVLWKGIDIGNVSFRPVEDRLAVSGEIKIFIVYSEDSSDNNNWYETTVSFNTEVECQGSSDMMLADISYDTGHEEIGIREDSDGEARIISMEATLELELKLFKKENASIVSDVYGVSCEVSAVTQEKSFRTLFADVDISEKINKIVKLEVNDPKPLQICNTDATATVEEITFNEDMLKVKGMVILQALYNSAEDAKGFYPVKENIPYEITRAISGINDVDIEHYSVDIRACQPLVTIKDSSQLEVKLVLDMHIFIYDIQKHEILVSLETSPINPEVLEKLPGFVIYYVKQGDSLWQIGRRYYVSVEKIKEINNLAGDEVKVGDRLLIVK